MRKEDNIKEMTPRQKQMRFRAKCKDTFVLVCVTGTISLMIGGFLWASNSDYETKLCHTYECVAVTETEIKTPKGNHYDVPEKWNLESGEHYLIMFEGDNVTPRKVVK